MNYVALKFARRHAFVASPSRRHITRCATEDLKVGKLAHGDLGQMQFYVNYFDRERRSEGDNPTLGLILSSHKNDAVVKYTLGEEKGPKIFTSRYQLYLPTIEELQNEIRREVRLLVPAAPKPAGKRTVRQ